MELGHLKSLAWRLRLFDTLIGRWEIDQEASLNVWCLRYLGNKSFLVFFRRIATAHSDRQKLEMNTVSTLPNWQISSPIFCQVSHFGYSAGLGISIFRMRCGGSLGYYSCSGSTLKSNLRNLRGFQGAYRYAYAYAYAYAYSTCTVPSSLNLACINSDCRVTPLDGLVG